MLKSRSKDAARFALARVGRDEMNLAEFPFALLSKRVPDGLNEIRFSDTIRGPSGLPVERRWTVTGSPKHGLPVAADELVYVALMEATKEQGFRSRIVRTSRHDLARRMGLPHGGAAYRQIKASLDRLVGVNIHAENAFWDPDKRTYGTVSFGLLDDYVLLDERKERTKDLPLGQVAWNRIIFASFLAGNIKRLDTSFFFSLKSPIARRLYRYLDKKRYDGKPHFQIGLEKLCFEHLGLSRSYKYASQLRQKLERGHQELLERGFLTSVTYEPMVRGGEKVIYVFARTEKPAMEDEANLYTDEEILLADLEELGVSPQVAQQLVAEYDEEVIRAQIEYLPARRVADPAAALVQSIREGWAEPRAYQEAKAAEAARREREEADLRYIREQQIEERAYEILEQALTLTEQMEIENLARQELAETNPMVAQRPHSVAYAVAERMIVKRILRERYPIDLERCRAQAAEELSP
ncbi:MAG: replication initiator protein A [Candidatus Zipacnadales bacterium]